MFLVVLNRAMIRLLAYIVTNAVIAIGKMNQSNAAKGACSDALGYYLWGFAATLAQQKTQAWGGHGIGMETLRNRSGAWTTSTSPLHVLTTCFLTAGGGCSKLVIV